MGIRDFLVKKLPPARWGLFIVKNRDALYEVRDNSPISLIGLVMKKFANGKEPVPPYSLWLHDYNPKNKINIQLASKSFSEDGEEMSNHLKEMIFSIDEKCLDFDSNQIFMECKTKKKLKILNKTNYYNLDEEIANMRKPKPPDFFDVLALVFGEDVSDNIVFPVS